MKKMEDGSVLALGSDKIYDSITDHNYKNRTIILGQVDSSNLEYITEWILKWNKEDFDIPKNKRKPIKLHIDSGGGSVISGFNLINVIKLSKTPVYGITMSTCASMGLLIYMACHKRYAFEDSVFLMHDGATGFAGTSSKVKDFMKFNDKLEERIKKHILTHSKISEEMYEEKYQEEWYHFADESQSIGITDKIIGFDCQLDDIL